jgi:hypothetical protein
MPLLRTVARLFRRSSFLNIGFLGFRLPKGSEEEMKRELDVDLHEEPQEPLPHSDLSEQERHEALRRYRRGMKERDTR